jgi:membrane protein involved in colicin uptake
MTAGIANLEATIAHLESATAEAREATRDAHSATKAMRQAERDARVAIAELEAAAVKAVEERMAEAVKAGLEKYAETLKKATGDGYDHVMHQFDRLMNIAMYGNEQGKGENIFDELRKRARELDEVFTVDVVAAARRHGIPQPAPRQDLPSLRPR